MMNVVGLWNPPHNDKDGAKSEVLSGQGKSKGPGWQGWDNVT